MQQINRAKEIRWMYAILLLSVILLLLAIAFTFRIFYDTGKSFSQIEKSNTIIEKNSEFESCLFQAESTVRLAVITKNASGLNLAKYHKDLEDNLQQIKIITTEKSEIKFLDTLSNLLEDRFALWGKIKEILNDSSSGPNLMAGLTAQGTYINDRLALLSLEISTGEKNLLSRSIQNTKNGITVISAVLTASTLFGMLCIWFAFQRLHGKIKTEIQVQAKLHSKIEELDRSNAHLERFAYTASHDLQEPLRKLHSFSERLVLQEKSNLSAEGGEIINRMQRFVIRMQQLIDDLLLFSRIISDKLVKGPVNLNVVLSEIKQNMSEKIMESGATIVSDRLPQITGYESQLQQLFQNLISNSIRYAKKDIAPQIIIKSSVVTGKIIDGIKPGEENLKYNLIAFTDNGIGFENRYSEKIFEIFQRLHGKSEYEGTGIGLAICKLVVENHQGYIIASGVEGIGATIKVYLPVT